MGFSAQVRCNCYRDGKTKPFPMPELESHFLYSPCHPYWEMIGNEVAYELFENWFWHEVCEHSGMGHYQEISNWPEYRAFRQGLETTGWQHFPMLHRYLPETCDGSMPVDAVGKAIEELAHFREIAVFGTNFCLVDEETGNVVYQSNASQNSVIVWASNIGIEICLDNEGYFIIQRHVRRDSAAQQTDSSPHVFFRAKRFEQRLLQPELTESQLDGQVEYFNPDTEERFRCNIPVGGSPIYQRDEMKRYQQGIRFEHPRLLHVEERKIGAEQFNKVIQGLVAICEIAIAFGNPVCWC